MFALSLSIAAINSIGIVETKLDIIGINEGEMKELMPDAVTYTDADIGMYIHGDFLKSLIIFAKIFAFTPVIISSILGAIGTPAIIENIISVLLYLPYIVGILQILSKFGLYGTE